MNHGFDEVKGGLGTSVLASAFEEVKQFLCVFFRCLKEKPDRTPTLLGVPRNANAPQWKISANSSGALVQDGGERPACAQRRRALREVGGLELAPKPLIFLSRNQSPRIPFQCRSFWCFSMLKKKSGTCNLHAPLKWVPLPNKLGR